MKLKCSEMIPVHLFTQSNHLKNCLCKYCFYYYKVCFVWSVILIYCFFNLNLGQNSFAVVYMIWALTSHPKFKKQLCRCFWQTREYSVKMVSPITDLKFVTIIVNSLNLICEQLEKICKWFTKPCLSSSFHINECLTHH